nr:DUF3352 domain-containing protein [Oscillochloris trichoides]
MPTPVPRERGLRDAFIGGLGITLIAILLGAAYLFWFLSAQRAASPAALLPPDTQIYVTMPPAISNLPEVARVDAGLRDQIGVADPERVRTAMVTLLGVDYYEAIATWIGGSMALAVRDMNSSDPSHLLEAGEFVAIIGSRNDPQAQAFIEKHHAARIARGERITSQQVGSTTIYVQEDGPASPIRAFTLFEHYVIFSNRTEAISAMINQLEQGTPSLEQLPAFTQFSAGLNNQGAGRYTNGAANAEVALSGLRELLTRLGE